MNYPLWESEGAEAGHPPEPRLAVQLTAGGLSSYGHRPLFLLLNADLSIGVNPLLPAGHLGSAKKAALF